MVKQTTTINVSYINPDHPNAIIPTGFNFVNYLPIYPLQCESSIAS